MINHSRTTIPDPILTAVRSTSGTTGLRDVLSDLTQFADSMQALRDDALSFTPAENRAAVLVKLREVAERVVGFASTFGERLRAIGNPASGELARQLNEHAFLAGEALRDPDAGFFTLATVIGMTNNPASKGKNDLAERVNAALRTCNE